MGDSTIQGKGAFRVKDWWGKASLLMGMIYLFAARYYIPFGKFIPLAILSLITITGFASMGYLFNDLFDIKKDAIAGKRNFLANKSVAAIILLFIVSAIFVLAPWWFLPKTGFSFILIGAQLLLFVIYSAPPIRLKERGLPGIVTDALYAHGLPSLLAMYTFSLAANFVFPKPDVWLLFAWQTLAGVRNIFIHQANDLDADKKSGSRNFVAGLSTAKFHALLRWLTAVEILLSIAFFAVLLTANLLFSCCIVVIVVLCFADLSFFTQKDTGQFLNSTWKYFPNNISEKWLPVAYLALLATGDMRFIVLIVLHVALFNFDFYVQASIKLYGRWKAIPLKGYLITLRIFLSYPVNYFIYYLLRIFGVDLKKQNISAIGYFRKIFAGKRPASK